MRTCTMSFCCAPTQVAKYQELAAQDIRMDVPLADACYEDRVSYCSNVPPVGPMAVRPSATLLHGCITASTSCFVESLPTMVVCVVFPHPSPPGFCQGHQVPDEVP
jgi:hypothetical protein